MSTELDDLRATVRSIVERQPDPWPVLIEQVGVAELGIPERHGGAGGGLPELAVVAAELGRELVASPFLGSFLASQALLEAGAPETVRSALAWTGAEGSWSVTCPAFAADFSGVAHYVLDAEGAELLLAVVATDEGTGLVRVTGSRVERTGSIDESRHLSTVAISAAERIGSGDFRHALRRVRDRGAVLLAAEQAGAAARAMEITLEYTKQRKQFGRAIGSFQAVKHRLADLHVLVETARSAAAAAALEPDRLAAVAKIHCSETLSTVAAEMIQLHGGIGVTWEHPAHRYFKRAHGSAALLGSLQRWLPRVPRGR